MYADLVGFVAAEIFGDHGEGAGGIGAIKVDFLRKTAGGVGVLETE